METKPIQVDYQGKKYSVSTEYFGNSQKLGIRVAVVDEPVTDKLGLGMPIAKLIPNGGKYDTPISITDGGHIVNAKGFYGWINSHYKNILPPVLEMIAAEDKENKTLANSLELAKSLEGVVVAK